MIENLTIFVNEGKRVVKIERKLFYENCAIIKAKKKNYIKLKESYLMLFSYIYIYTNNKIV